MSSWTRRASDAVVELRRGAAAAAGAARTRVRRRVAILAASTALAATSGALAAGPCDTPRVLIERFLSADCERCWADAPPAAAGAWTLDWIAPSPNGDAAPLAAAALPDAGERLQALGATLAPDAVHEARWPLGRPPAVRLRLGGGPAWNGYLGLQLQTRGKPPPGAVAYVALVEHIEAGTEGTPVARRLVRSVAGPLPLDPDGRRATQWRALRLPDGAQPARLHGMAWWLDGQARLRGVVQEGCSAVAR